MSTESIESNETHLLINTLKIVFQHIGMHMILRKSLLSSKLSAEYPVSTIDNVQRFITTCYLKILEIHQPRTMVLFLF